MGCKQSTSKPEPPKNWWPTPPKETPPKVIATPESPLLPQPKLVVLTADTNIKGHITTCVFPKIIDGDTADIQYSYNSTIVTERFRFWGFDTAEMHPRKDDPNRINIKYAAGLGKDYLTKLVTMPNTVYIVEFTENDKKWKRRMGRVWCVNKDIYGQWATMQQPPHPIGVICTEANEIRVLMLNSGLAKPYYGGKKS